jgi:hypothetical protein
MSDYEKEKEKEKAAMDEQPIDAAPELDSDERLFIDTLLRHDLDDRFSAGERDAIALVEWHLGVGPEPTEQERGCASPASFERFTAGLPAAS